MFSGMDSTQAMMAELMSNTERSAFFTSRLSHTVQLTEMTRKSAKCQHFLESSKITDKHVTYLYQKLHNWGSGLQ